MDITGVYEHFKGNKYRVYGKCLNRNSNETFIIYKPLYKESGFWIREYNMFFEKIEREGIIRDRFKLVELEKCHVEENEFYAKHSETLDDVKIYKECNGEFVI